DVRVGVSLGGKEIRDRQHVEVVRVHIGHLVPGEGHGHGGAGCATHGPGRGDGPVAGGLVEVEEDAFAAFLLPPGGGGQVGDAFLDLAGQADDRVADVDEVPFGSDPDQHVDASAAGGFRISGQTGVGEDLAQDTGDLHRVGEVGAGLRVEV